MELSADVVKHISSTKKEGEWMLRRRMDALSLFSAMPMPKFGPDISAMKLDDVEWYAEGKGKKKSWEEVDPAIREKFEKLGVPEAERKFLAGLEAQLESEAVYGNLKKEWEGKGVIFTNMDEALQKHPELVRKYLGKAIPTSDNKFAALTDAVWSGGSFLFVPKGVKLEAPLHAFFMISKEGLGQFERTVIIAEEGSSVHYVEGCSAELFPRTNLHTGVVEIFAEKGAHVRYTTLQNWSHNVYNLVTQRGIAKENATIEWIDGNMGCLTSDTKVLVDGDIKEIKDIKIGEVVYSLSPDFELSRNRVSGMKENPPTTVYQLETENHRIVKATANHPFLVMQKVGKLSNVSWKRLDEIRSGDLIAISGEIPDTGKSYKISFSPGRGIKPIKIPSESTQDLLWLLGFYIGDGYSENSRIYFAVPKKDKSRAKVLDLVKAIFGFDCEECGDVVLRVNSADLKDFFVHLGFYGNAREKRVPKWVFRLPKDQRLAFINGYIAADGNIRKGHKNISICSANRDLLEDVKTLAIGCGSNPTKISKWSRIEKLPLGKEIKEYTHYVLYFGEKKLDLPVYFTRVLSINPAGEEITYDIEVDGAHNFIANGIFVHNSKITMKYPTVILAGEGAKGSVLSISVASGKQNQDSGGKVVHLAPNTSSTIISKSVSSKGGVATFRASVDIKPEAKNSNSFVKCQGIMLDSESKNNSIPKFLVGNGDSFVSHEASAGRLSEKKLFYLMSRGLSRKDAEELLVVGFLESFLKELPFEYAVEFNRLLQMEIEGQAV